MAKSRLQTLLALGALGILGLILAILGLYVYVRATTAPIHPDVQSMPSVADAPPAAAWAGAATKARQIARDGLAEQNLPGLSVAVGVGTEVVWAEGFGWADIENQARVRPNTRFRIGTASTMLTSAAVGLLLEKNRLKLDEEIQAYVPGFPKKPWPVTLRQVMGHVAGLRDDAGDEEDVTSRCERTTDALERFANADLRFEPGTQYRVSDYGWILVSAAVETAAGEPLFSFMRSKIFEPLGMSETRGDSGAAGAPGAATYYFPRFAAETRYGPQAPSEVDYSCFSGASGFLSTPSDLVRFGMALNSGKLLQPATVQLLQTSGKLASGQETGYGLGWDLETVTLAGAPRSLVVHDGDLRGGIVTTFLSFPERGLVVSVIANTSFADTSSLARAIAEAFAMSAPAPAPK